MKSWQLKKSGSENLHLIESPTPQRVLARFSFAPRRFKHGNLKPGETVLLQGSGGVSLFALQLAVAHGARVLVTPRSPGKIVRLKQLGAAEAIDTSANAAWDEVIERAKRILCDEEETSLIDIAARCGFSSQSHMTRVFREQTGVTPSAFKRRT
jgi:NADPH:quinone reductase-like Zn-dependent oxidoreductase